MTRPGRPNLGAHHVDGLEGSAASKERLRVILKTLSGEITVKEACSRLGLSPARFDELRTQALQAAVMGLEPKPMGRPRTVLSAEDATTRKLTARIQELEEDVVIAETRAELAEVLGARSSTKAPKAEESSGGGKKGLRIERRGRK